jgi:hypothetical protein
MMDALGVKEDSVVEDVGVADASIARTYRNAVEAFRER